MRISSILNEINTFEKNPFLRNIEQIISNKPKHYKKIEKLLSQIDGQIKNADNQSVESVFNLISDEYIIHIKNEFSNTTSQLDILIDILIRDGNSLMKREWLLKLYDKEIKSIKLKTKSLEAELIANSDLPRIKTYKLYQNCVRTAYTNDEKVNREKKVTIDEQSILNTLIEGLDLSSEEVKLLNYSIVPLKKAEIDEVISYLASVGVILYSKKHYTIYVPDEIVDCLRKIRGKEVSDKVFRRVLKQLKDSQINLVCKIHNIDRKLERKQKIREIIFAGLNFTNVMLEGIHKDGTSKTDKKAFLTDLIENKLRIDDKIKGSSLEEKFSNLLKYFIDKDTEDNIRISIHGFEKLLIELSQEIKGFEKLVRDNFEIQDSVELNAKNLLLLNLKPIDILYILDTEIIKTFCQKKSISIRGNEILNILETYKDIQNLYLENYVNISRRDLALLRANNIEISEAELGIQFESLTKLIFKNMGLNVDEKLRKSLNTNKDQIDILIKLSENEIMIIECKTKKDKKFNTYSSASRQVKAYKNLAEKHQLKVSKTFIIAPDFSEDFINECGLDYELNLSLITSDSLLTIYNAFHESELSDFPYKILLRDVLIDSNRVVKSILK